MTFQRLMIAAALFLAAVCLKIYMPDRAETVLPAVQEQIDANSFALLLPGEAVAWLDWN